MPLLLTLALRNLSSHRGKSFIVGSIMLFGTVLVVAGLGLLDGIETAMRRSITRSVAGDFQLYDAEAKDPLVLLGSTFISVPDVGRIEHFEAVHDVASRVEGVAAVVPMGFDIGAILAPGQLERALGQLRSEVRAYGGVSESIARSAQTVRGLLEELAEELENQKAISSEPERLDRRLAKIRPALSDSFWTRFRTAPLEVLEVLDTEIAPLEDGGGQQLLFRFLGTDFERFREHFSGFMPIKGTVVPAGQRGFLFSDKYYERRVKHPVARGLDQLLDNADDGLTIAEDPGQKSRVRRLARQWRRITRELDETEAQQTQAFLQKELKEASDLSVLLERFLTVSDDNLRRRHRLFYEVIAPRIDLYSIDPGDTVTIRTLNRNGFMKSVNVKFFGTFGFKGLESSDLAGIYNLTDLVTFRQLLGVMSAEDRAELADLREQVGLQDLSVEEAEDALFGGEGTIVEEVPAEEARIETLEEMTFGGVAERGLDDAVRASDLRTGVVLNAAVVLEPGADRALTRVRLEAALAAADLPVQVTGWQSAAGLIGQFIVVIRFVLYVAIVVIFLVALVIINNSMVMATMERVTEIGTLRAIGAHRSLVLGMFFVETMSLGLIAGVLGVALGGALIALLGTVGLPAPTAELRFLFGGPRLFPELEVDHVLAALLSTLAVSVVSTAYPAVLGASIQPVEAMRTEE